MAAKSKVTLAQFEHAVECSIGWCPHCESFTRPETEPDAEDYDCPECGENDVVGAELALVARMFEPSLEGLT